MEVHGHGIDRPESSVSAKVAAIWRIEAARLVASLARLTGDVPLAEDMAQDALVTALETWPAKGVPENPGAWLMTAARNRGLDRIRRDRNLERKYGQLAAEIEREDGSPGPEKSVLEADPTGDDVLTLIFTACHPALSGPSQVAMTLKVVGGLSTDEIARAFLVPRSTIAQRIARAKKAMRESDVGFVSPGEAEMSERLGAVLGIIYLIFNEGYAATSGGDWMRSDLSGEALRLGRVLVGLAPNEPEVHGLLALMEIQASRFPARIGESGEPILLQDQDRSRWDRLLIRLGLGRIESARRRGGDGPYLIQAEIAACHARALRPDDTDWGSIVDLYGSLLGKVDSPVVRLNRAVAISMSGRPAEALGEVDRLVSEEDLREYHLLHAARGEILEGLGRTQEAAEEFRAASAMTENETQRGVLERKAQDAEEF